MFLKFSWKGPTFSSCN